MFESFDRSAKVTRTSIPTAFLFLIAGCGYAEYETRLNETKKYYSYRDRIEQSLAPKWIAEGNVMELRVPRQFNLIPAPQPVEREGAKDEPAADSRQPDYLNLTLPGLYGAWQASFKVAKPTENEECRGYIYALSNYQQLAGKQAAEGVEFLDKLKALLGESLKTEMKDEPTETFPPGTPISQYQTQFTYDVCRGKGVEISRGKGADASKTKYTFDVYSRVQGSVIGVIVIVLPMDMESPQKTSERIPLMLSSFNFTKDPPKPGSSTGGVPAQPRTPGADF